MRRVGEFILEYKYILIVLLLIISVFFSLQLNKLQMVENEDTYFSKNDSSLIIYRNFQQDYEQYDHILIAFESKGIFEKGEIKYIDSLCRVIEKIDGIEEVVSLSNVDDVSGTENGIEIKPFLDSLTFSKQTIQKKRERYLSNPFIVNNLLTKDEKTVSFIVKIPKIFLNKSSKNVQLLAYNKIRSIIEHEENETSRKFYLGGDIVVDIETENLMNKDISTLFPISLLISIVILFLFFRNLSGVIFPLLIVILSIIWTLGLMALMGRPLTPISPTLFPLITVISIATNVHLQNYFKNNLEFAQNKKEFILTSFQKVGVPCFYTSLTTAVGFGSLVISPIVGVRDMGMFASFGIMASFLISIIVTPIVFYHQKIKEVKFKNNWFKNILDHFLNKVIQINLKHGTLIIILTIGLVILMLAGIPRIKTEGSLLSYSKKNSRLRRDVEFFDKNMGGISSLEVILYKNEDEFKNPEILEKIQLFQSKVNLHEKVSTSYSVVDFVKIISKALNSDKQEFYSIPQTKEEIAQSLFLYEISGGEDLLSYVTDTYDACRISIRTKQMSTLERKTLIADIEHSISEIFGSTRSEITGFECLLSKITDNLVSTQIKSLAVAFGIILLIMFILFGLKVGLISLVPNIIPIIFFIGVMGYFNFNLNVATSLIAAIIIGIVVDDTIHLFYAYKKEFEKVKEDKTTIKNVLLTTGSAICLTSLILTLGFAVFWFSQTKFIIEFGILSGIGIVVALLADLFISPILLSKTNFLKK